MPWFLQRHVNLWSLEIAEEDMVDIFQADTAGIFSIHNQTKGVQERYV